MKMVWIAWALCPALALPFAAQSAKSKDASKSNKSALVRVRDDDASPSREEADHFDRDAWRAKLGARDLDARERDLDALIERARTDDDARDALKEWAANEKDIELAWTSRMALRELDRRPRSPARGMHPFGGMPSVPGQPGGFDDLQRRMEELQQSFGGMDSMFGDLQRQMDELMRTAPGRSPFAPGAPSSPGGGPGGSKGPGAPGGMGGQRNFSMHSEGFSMKSGPDGVEVEVLEDENGEQHKKTYQAKTLDELLEAHPELRDRIDSGGGNSFRVFGGRAGAGAGKQPGAQWFDPDAFQAPAKPLIPGVPSAPGAPGASPSGPILGITCQPLSAEQSEELGLDEQQGLSVATVVPGSLAERLGIRPGDVVAELNGVKLHGTADVKKVLTERRATDEVRATVYDAKQKKRNLSYTPPAQEPSKEKREKGDDSKGF